MSNRAMRRLHSIISVALIVATVCPVLPHPGVAYAAPVSASLGNNGLLSTDVSLDNTSDRSGFRLDDRPLSVNPEQATDASTPVFDPLADTLSVARVQSTYVPSGLVSNTLVITLQVSNASLVDTIRNVIITDTLANGVHAAHLPDNATLSGSLLAIAVGDLPPAEFKSVTVTLDVGTVAPPANLDSGAHVVGNLENLVLQNWTAPARLIVPPPEGEGTLSPTVDADSHDPYVLQKAGQLHQDPQALIAFVRDEVGFESYRGSLRGARGTLWSMAGNALDKSNLLVAMLRGAGVPARYERGTLDGAHASALILSMFESVNGGYGGYIPPGTVLSDPANDAQLLSETQDHWWVNVFDVGNWRRVNPLLDGEPNWLAAVADIQPPVSEVPSGEHHYVTMRMRVETATQLPGPPGTTTVLSHTWASAALVGRPITLRHEVDADFTAGLVFSRRSFIYKPWFDDGGEGIPGDSYSELFSNFPFGNFFLTGAWLDIDLVQPGGARSTVTRELHDRAGIAARTQGGLLPIDLSNPRPLFDPWDSYHILIEVSRHPEQFIRQLGNTVLSFEDRVAPAAELYQSIISSTLPVDVRLRNEARHTILQAQGSALRWAGYQFFWLSGDVPEYVLEAAAHVRIYNDQPRAIIMASEYPEGVLRETSDLIAYEQRHIAEPGQSEEIENHTHPLKGAVDSLLEELIWPQDAENGRMPSVPRLFHIAGEQATDVSALESVGSLAELASLTISPQAKAHVFQALLTGKQVIVPSEMIELPQAITSTTVVTQTVGWWLIDPVDGSMIGVGESGLHQAAVEYDLQRVDEKIAEIEEQQEAAKAQEVARQLPDWFERVRSIQGTQNRVAFVESEFRPWLDQMFTCETGAGHFGDPFKYISEIVIQKITFFIAKLELALAMPVEMVLIVDPPLSDAWLAQHVVMPDEYVLNASSVVTTTATLIDTSPPISGTVFTQRVQARDQWAIAISHSQVLSSTVGSITFEPAAQFMLSNELVSFSAADGTFDASGQAIEVSQGLTLKGVSGSSRRRGAPQKLYRFGLWIL